MGVALKIQNNSNNNDNDNNNDFLKKKKKEQTRGVADQPAYKEMSVGVNHGPSQRTQL